MPGVPLCKPDLGDRELAAVRRVFEDGNVSHGPAVARFESALGELVGAPHAVALNSCTSGLFLVAEYLRETRGPGEVIVPSFTFVASANAISCAGMQPRFVDVEWETGNTSAALIEPAISQETRAIMVVHYAGRPCAMPEIMTLAQNYDLTVIEDSAECLGATVGGRAAGSYGVGVFSFYGTKNITTGEGGMVTTTDDRMAEWLRLKIAHGVRKGSYERDGVGRAFYRNALVAGHNFRLSNLQAAIGLVQLERLQEMNHRRYRVAADYRDALRGDGRVHLPEDLPEGQHSYQMYPVKVDAAIRDRVLDQLWERDIGASVHFDPPAHWQSCYSKDPVVLPTTEDLARSTITLPISSVQTKEQTLLVARCLQEALSNG